MSYITTFDNLVLDGGLVSETINISDTMEWASLNNAYYNKGVVPQGGLLRQTNGVVDLLYKGTNRVPSTAYGNRNGAIQFQGDTAIISSPNFYVTPPTAPPTGYTFFAAPGSFIIRITNSPDAPLISVGSKVAAVGSTKVYTVTQKTPSTPSANNCELTITPLWTGAITGTLNIAPVLTVPNVKTSILNTVDVSANQRINSTGAIKYGTLYLNEYTNDVATSRGQVAFPYRFAGPETAFFVSAGGGTSFSWYSATDTTTYLIGVKVQGTFSGGPLNDTNPYWKTSTYIEKYNLDGSPGGQTKGKEQQERIRTIYNSNSVTSVFRFNRNLHGFKLFINAYEITDSGNPVLITNPFYAGDLNLEQANTRVGFYLIGRI